MSFRNWVVYIDSASSLIFVNKKWQIIPRKLSFSIFLSCEIFLSIFIFQKKLKDGATKRDHKKPELSREREETTRTGSA